jgi:hypothetical protein
MRPNGPSFHSVIGQREGSLGRALARSGCALGSSVVERAMLPPGPIISLAYRVPADRRDQLLAFLRDAIPFYERPGRIRVGLYESVDEPGLYLELVAYADEVSYAADQERVEQDVEMLAVLDRFKGVVGGPVEVRRMRPVDVTPGPAAEMAAKLAVEVAPGLHVEPAAFNDHAYMLRSPRSRPRARVRSCSSRRARRGSSRDSASSRSLGTRCQRRCSAHVR